MRAWISRLIPATRGVGSSFFFFLGRGGALVVAGVRPKMSAASRAEAMVVVVVEVEVEMEEVEGGCVGGEVGRQQVEGRVIGLRGRCGCCQLVLPSHV